MLKKPSRFSQVRWKHRKHHHCRRRQSALAARPPLRQITLLWSKPGKLSKAMLQVIKTWRGLWRSQEEREEQGRQTQGIGRTYRLISRDSLPFTLRPNPVITNLPKTIISAYIQLKTGKGLLKSFQYTIRKTPDDRCFCLAAKRQNTRHLLLECEAYRDQRASLRKQLKGIPLGLNVLFCTAKGQKALAWFLQETGICTVGWQNDIVRPL